MDKYCNNRLRNSFNNYFINVSSINSNDTRAHMTEISSFASINEFFVRDATERNTR